MNGPLHRPRYFRLFMSSKMPRNGSLAHSSSSGVKTRDLSHPKFAGFLSKVIDCLNQNTAGHLPAWSFYFMGEID
jgi:hypothetical protein